MVPDLARSFSSVQSLCTFYKAHSHYVSKTPKLFTIRARGDADIVKDVLAGRSMRAMHRLVDSDSGDDPLKPDVGILPENLDSSSS